MMNIQESSIMPATYFPMIQKKKSWEYMSIYYLGKWQLMGKMFSVDSSR